MISLAKSLRAWGTPEFTAALKHELESLRGDQLLLQRELVQSSYALDDPHTVILIAVDDGATTIRARVGVFFSGIIAGCSCADDPTSVEPVNEYCELWVEIDKGSAEAKVTSAVTSALSASFPLARK